MSYRPTGFGNKQGKWDSYFYERAGPRMSGQGEKRYHHPVVQIPSDSAPHYAQASNLYPMRTSSERDNIYRYKPGSNSLGRPASPISVGSTSGNGGQAIVIPVHHMGATRTSVPSGLVSTDTGHGSIKLDGIDFTGTRSPYFRPTISTGSPRPGGRTTVNTNDPEAEVDALTDALMKSMETRSNTFGLGGGMSSVNEGPTSPVSNLRRASGPNTPVNLSSPIGRLQQHIGLNSNGGRGSPLNVGTTPAAGSSTTNSPTGSSSSVPNTVENSGNTMISSITGQNSCFRCRRPLVPPEGSTLNPVNSNRDSNVITITGALSARLHVACFTCYRCAAPLKPDAYYHSLRRLLCPACVRDGAVESCSNCRRPIGDRIVHALGMPYHPNCFVCVVCCNRLDCRPFTIDVHGRLHCLDDFHRRYAPRCAVCARPIAPEPGSQEARRVVAGESNYHLACFGVQTVQQPQSTLGPQSSKLRSGVMS